MITILHYGIGNLGSIQNAFRRIGEEVLVTSNPDDILIAEKIILPGVGSFDQGVTKLKQGGHIEPLLQVVFKKRTPILGICLGMQLMTQSSEEGNLPGLGWINGRTIKFVLSDMQQQTRIPHIGWNNLFIQDESHELLEAINKNDRFYFAHSFHLQGVTRETCTATTTYGYTFPSVIQQGNIYGIQCHPERSHHSGLKILKNFARL